MMMMMMNVYCVLEMEIMMIIGVWFNGIKVEGVVALKIMVKQGW
jgi:hypothetical protein